MLFVAAFSQLPQEKKIQKYNFSKKGFYISINYRNTSCSRLQMCLADCDVVWGKLSQGAGCCSPQQLWDVALLTGLSSWAQLPKLSSPSSARGLSSPSSALQAQLPRLSSAAGTQAATARSAPPGTEKGWKMGTSVSCVSMRAGTKPHRDQPGPAASGDSHSTQCSLFFSYKIFTSAFLRKKVGGKAPQNKNCLTSL